MEKELFPILRELNLLPVQRRDGSVYVAASELYPVLDRLGIREAFDDATKGEHKAAGGPFAWDTECVLRKLLGRDSP